LFRIARSNNIDPREIETQYKVIVCRQGTLRLTGFLAVVIRLFQVESLKMRVSDSHGNTEKMDWDEGAIAVLAGESNVRLSKNGNLVCIFFTYKKRIVGNDPHDNARPNITEL
jgi:hypothetical protein